jgi:hypothetical protein
MKRFATVNSSRRLTSRRGAGLGSARHSGWMRNRRLDRTHVGSTGSGRMRLACAEDRSDRENGASD